MNILQRIGAVLVGLLCGGMTVAVVEWISSRMHPMPEGLDMKDTEAMKAWASSLPTSAFLMLLLAWGLGCVVAAFVARRIAPSRAVLPALIVCGLLLTATIFNLIMLPHLSGCG